MKKVFFILIVVLILRCENDKTGHFGFVLADTSSFNLIESYLFKPRVFKKYQDPIIFDSDKVLWFIYRPSSPEIGKTYGVSLAKKSLGWIEVDLKIQIINQRKQEITDYYENLETGYYQLKISKDNKIIDSINFEIKESQQENLINYEVLPYEEETIEDDILFFSKE